MSSLDADARRLSTMQAEHVVPNAKGNLDVGNGKASENNQEQLKNSPLTMEDIWRVLNEVKSSVDQVLLGVSNAKYQVKEGDPSARDPTVMPLIANKVDGTRVTLWAKMDTGADRNLISPALVSRLGRDGEVETRDGGLIHEIDGKTFEIRHFIRLEFLAGLSNQSFAETFYVIDAKAETSPAGSADSRNASNENAKQDILQLPDILLGGPFLKHSHALVIDPDFENPVNPEYEVLAEPPEAGLTTCYAGSWSGSPRYGTGRALVKHPAPARGSVKLGR